MTKAEIVNEVAKATGLEKVTVQAVVEAYMESVKNSLIKGNPVYLRGFGSFIIKERAQKAARNITKNTTMIIPAHKIPAFKPAKVFVGAVKNAKYFKSKSLCLAVKRERDIRWRRTNGKNVCARIDTRRNSLCLPF
jgi:DNA-binding protein HU-beta